MIKIENYYGTFFLERKYDVDTNETFYDVYDEPLENELYGNYIGEFMPKHFFDFEDEEEEKQLFYEEFMDWSHENADKIM